MAKTIISERWHLASVEKKKLITSFGYAVMGLVAYFAADYLTQFGLPEQFEALAPFLPFVVNFLRKWAGEHKYTV